MRRAAGRRGLLASALLLAALLPSPAAQEGSRPPDAPQPAIRKLDAPQLVAVLRLSSLQALQPAFPPSAAQPPPAPEAAGGRSLPPAGEPTGLAACGEGILLGFRDRFLSLGPLFQIDWRTARDLRLGRELARELRARDFLASHLSLTPLGEIILYDAESGAAAYAHPLTRQVGWFRTGVTRPIQFAGLPSGGFALLQAGKVSLFERREGGDGGRPPEDGGRPGGLARRDLLLPAGVYTALAAREGRDGGTLWVFDWQKRRVVVISPRGDIVDSIALRAGPAALPFAQVLAPCADGGMLLGGPGELWRFSPDGEPRWEMDDLPAAPGSGAAREALPAVYALAAMPDASFYLLDVPSGRVFLFREPPRGAEDSGAGEDAASAPRRLPPAAGGGERREVEARLAAFAAGRWSPGQPASSRPTRGAAEEALRFLLDHGLPLLALSLEGLPAEAAGAIEHALRLGRAQALDGLSRRLQEELLLPEAEGVCAEALELYRSLRLEDPVDPLPPRRLRELGERRQGLREILFEEPLLEAGFPQRMQLYRAEPLRIANRSGAPLEDLQVAVRFSGVPFLEEVRFARARLAPGEQVQAALSPRPERGQEAFFQPLREDAAARLSIRVRFRHQGQARGNYLGGPVTIRLSEP